MNALVFEHVPVADLPEAWRARLGASGGSTVTVRIEPDASATPPVVTTAEDPAFGIWRDRDDLADVPAHVEQLRASRYGPDGSRNET